MIDLVVWGQCFYFEISSASPFPCFRIEVVANDNDNFYSQMDRRKFETNAVVDVCCNIWFDWVIPCLNLVVLSILALE